MGKTNDRYVVQRNQTLENAQRKSELDAVKHLMQTPLGRAMAWRILDVTGCNRPIKYKPNAMDLAHDVGVRELGDWLLEEIREACPEQELVMRSEYLQRVKRAQLAEQQANDESDNPG